MDGVLRAIGGDLNLTVTGSFNPCSNGWCTSRFGQQDLLKDRHGVSILVLMDGVLRVPLHKDVMPAAGSFNPCSNGWCTSSDDGKKTYPENYRFQSLF